MRFSFKMKTGTERKGKTVLCCFWPKLYRYLRVKTKIHLLQTKFFSKNNFTDMETWQWRDVTWHRDWLSVSVPLHQRGRPVTSAWPFHYIRVTVTLIFTVTVNVCFKSLIWMLIFTKTSRPASMTVPSCFRYRFFNYRSPTVHPPPTLLPCYDYRPFIYRCRHLIYGMNGGWTEGRRWMQGRWK